MNLFICYSKCSTCKKARDFLNENHISFQERDIKSENPSYEELKKWYLMSDFSLRKFFNTSGNLYKEMNLKEKLPLMSEEEQLQLLSSNGMLVKRPLLITDEKVFVGFKESEYLSLL